MVSDQIRHEHHHRLELWDTLHREGGPGGVVPFRLRELGTFGGAQGVWVDKVRTSRLTSDAIGVTVALLHTGSAYADDLDDEGVLYHYPSTKRPARRDVVEIEATKAAGRLRLPVFVIAYPSFKAKTSNVRLAWVEEWIDETRMFLVLFGNTRPRCEPVCFRTGHMQRAFSAGRS